MTDALDLTKEDIERLRAESEEVDPDEEEAQPEPDPAPEPAPEAAAAPVSVDPDKIERAAKTYLTAIAKAFGDASDQLQPCSRCSGEILGFEPAQPPLELRQAPDKEACPLCEGLGTFLSGAKLGEFVTVSCTRCNGKGYVEKAMDAQPIFTAVQVSTPHQPDPYPGYGIPFVPVPNGSPDAYNRPSGHPHWGMPPEYSKAAS